MGSSFLITTKNRREDLLACVGTILAQSVLPDELVVIDGGDDPVEEAIGSALGSSIPLVYRRTAPGRTAQLNAGIAVTAGDPVVIIDDDVLLEPDFHAEMLKAFESGGPEVGGVQGSIVGDTLRPLPVRLFKALFLLSRHTKDSAGKVLPSGYYTSPARATGLREAQALRLCGVAYRRKVLDEFSFDESLQGYALKEDVDHSYRVSQKYRLLISPTARFRHMKTPESRIGVREKYRMHVVNNYNLFRKNLGGRTWRWAAFCWAMLGRLLYSGAKSAASRNPGFVLGTLDGLRDVVTGSARLK